MKTLHNRMYINIHWAPGTPLNTENTCPKWCTLALQRGFADGSVLGNLPANTGDAGSIPGSGRSPEGGNGGPFQSPCLGHPTDREGWWATVHGDQRLDADFDSNHVHLRALEGLHTLLFTSLSDRWGTWGLKGSRQEDLALDHQSISYPDLLNLNFYPHNVLSSINLLKE